MSAARLLVFLAATIFCGEFAIMIALDQLHIENEWIQNSMDSTALVIIVFPALYFFVFKTVQNQNRELTENQARLQAAKDELEIKVKQRTNELTDLNRELTKTVGRINLRQAETERLSEMVNFFQACRSLDEALGLGEAQWQALFPGFSGTLFIMNASHNLLEKAAAWGQPFTTESFHAPDECWAQRRGRPHITGGPKGMAPCRHLPSAGSGWHICLPLATQGEALGTLCLYASDAPNKGDRRESDLAAFYGAVSESLALAIANLSLRDNLRNQAIRDQLTGLFNRRYLLETLDRELSRAAARDQPVAVAIVDIDHFKRFNDNFGHAAGDAVLARIGLVLRDWKRGEDIVARYGGEEFAVVLPDLTASLALQRLEQLRQKTAMLSIEHHGKALPPVTLSIGLAVFPEHTADRDALINSADHALYSSKRDGRNRVTVADLGPSVGPSVAQLIQKNRAELKDRELLASE